MKEKRKHRHKLVNCSRLQIIVMLKKMLHFLYKEFSLIVSLLPLFLQSFAIIKCLNDRDRIFANSQGNWYKMLCVWIYIYIYIYIYMYVYIYIYILRQKHVTLTISH